MAILDLSDPQRATIQGALNDALDNRADLKRLYDAGFTGRGLIEENELAIKKAQALLGIDE